MIARMKKILGWRVLVGLLVVLVALPPIVRNAEWHSLNASARAGTTGAYVQLGEGLAHYEMAGPDTAPPVLLVHGFSVPSYIFDPTFAAPDVQGPVDLVGLSICRRPPAASRAP